MLELIKMKYATFEKFLIFELVLALFGLIHFTISYTATPDQLMRAFVIDTFLILAAIILFIITYSFSMKILEKGKHADS
jgi:hypothetical protein